MDNLNANNPWPGLESYSEADQRFFFGRKAETAELAALIRRAELSVFFGQSGLGKTSILRAGLAPVLRAEDCMPVYVRLKYGEPGGLVEQVKLALDQTFAAEAVEAPKSRAAGSLWEFFYRRDSMFWSADSRLITPVIIFDQFEEIFTLGRESEPAREQTRDLLRELEQLTESRAPESVRSALQENPAAARLYRSNKKEFKVLFVVREDYLPELEELRPRFRWLGANRLRLEPMRASQALEVVSKPAPRLVTESDALAIVDIISRPKRQASAAGTLGELQGREVVPALVSLVCAELNKRRQLRGERTISASLLTEAKDEILRDFYEREVKALPASARSYLEDNLLTAQGFRARVAYEDAWSVPGLSREIIERLVRVSLLHKEESGAMTWIELSHDLLAGVVQASRKERKDRQVLLEAEGREAEARAKLRRSRRQTYAFALVTLLALCGMVFAATAWYQAKRNRAAAQRSESEARDRLVDSWQESGRQALLRGDQDEALVYLGEAYRSHLAKPSPKDRPALRWLLAEALTPLRSELASCQGHREAVSALAFAPDGRVLFSGSLDGTVKQWESRLGTLQATRMRVFDKIIALHLASDRTRLVAASRDGRIQIMGLGPDQDSPVVLDERASTLTDVATQVAGPLLAAAHADGAIALWNVATGKLLGRFSTGQGRIFSVGFDRNGSRLIVGGSDGAACVWEVRGFNLLATLGVRDPQNGTAVTWARFSPDAAESRIATLNASGEIQLWDTARGSPVASLAKLPSGDANVCACVCFSEDGARLVTGAIDGRAAVWQTANGEFEAMLRVSPARDRDAIESMIWIPGTDYAAFGSASGRLTIWDASSHRELFKAATHSGAITTLATDGRGQTLAAGSSDGISSTWSLAEALPFRRRRAHADAISALAWNPDGSRFVTASLDRSARLWEGRTAEPIGAPMSQGKEWVLDAKIDPTGRYLATLGAHKVRFWDTRNAKPEAGMKSLDSPANVSFTSLAFRDATPPPELITGYSDGSWFIWRIPPGAPGERSWGWHPDDISSMDPIRYRSTMTMFYPGNKNLVLSVSKGQAHLWRRPGHGQLFDYPSSLPAIQSEVVAACVSGDRRHIVVGTRSGRLLVYNDLSNLIHDEQLHRGPILSLAASRSGRYVVTAGEDHTAKVYDLQNLHTLSVMTGHGARVNSAEFSPDESLVVTASSDGSVKLWDVESGCLLASMDQHAQDVVQARFSPAGDAILSGDRRGVILVWRISRALPDNFLPLVNRRIPFHMEGGRVMEASLVRSNLRYGAEGALLDGISPGPVIPGTADAGFALERCRIHVLEEDLYLACQNMLRVGASAGDTSAGRFLFHAALRQFDGMLSLHQAQYRTIQTLSPSEDGRFFATPSTDGTVAIWRQSDGDLVSLCGQDKKGDWAVSDGGAWRGGEKFVSGSANDTATVWRVSDGARLLTLDHAKARAKDGLAAGEPGVHAAFIPRQPWIVTVDTGGVMRLWDERSGAFLRSLVGRAAGKFSVLAVSKDGRFAAAGGSDGQVSLYDFLVSKPILAATGGHGEIRALDFSADGLLLAVAGEKGMAVICRSQTGKVLAQLPHPAPAIVGAIRFDRAGTRVVTGCSDGTARIWRVGQGKPDRLLTGPKGTFLEGAEFDSAGDRILTVGDDRHARIWDAATGGLLGDISGFRADRCAAAFSADGRRILAASGEAVSVYDAGKVRSDASELPVLAGAVAARSDPVSGEILAAVWQESRLRIFDRSRGQEISAFTLPATYFGVRSVGLGPMRIAPSFPRKARQPMLDDGFRHKLQSELERLGGLKVYLAEERRGPPAPPGEKSDGAEAQLQLTLGAGVESPRIPVLRIRLVSARGGEPIAEIVRPLPVADDASLVSEVKRQFESNRGVPCAAFAPGGRSLAVGGADGGVTSWDVRHGTLLDEMGNIGSRVIALGCTRGERTMVAVGESGQAWLLQGSGLPPTPAAASGDFGGVTDGVFDPSGRHLLITGRNGIARIYDRSGRAAPLVLSGHRDGIRSGLFSPDGWRVLTIGYDGELKIWNARTGAIIASLLDDAGDSGRSAAGSVLAAAWSPDGNFIATGHGTTAEGESRGTARLWDAPTARLLFQYSSDSPVESVLFDPASERLTLLTRAGAGLEHDLAMSGGVKVTLRKYRRFLAEFAGN